MNGLIQDFRYGFRSLAKDRRFALLAILALGLGIGSATVIFSAIYGVILNTFPFRASERVTSFAIHDATQPSDPREALSLPEFLDFREKNHVFEDISGEFGGFGSTPVAYRTSDSTFEFSADFMSVNSFEFFGMSPVIGRLVTPEDTKPGSTPVFMMSYKLWREHFNSDRNVVGKSFVLNGIARTLVGIMRPRFRWGWADLWIPFPLDRSQIAADPNLANQRVWCVGRLKPDVGLKSAAADLNVIAHQLSKVYPADYPKQFTVTATRLSDRVLGGFKDLVYPLAGGVLMLLLIACSNVTNLLLARATVRERETAIRKAIGASRGRLVRQLLVESFILAAAGSLAGCLIAYVGVKVLVPLIPYNALPQEAVIELNPAVLLFSLGVTVLTTFACGVAPAIHSMHGELESKLASSGKEPNAVFRHGKLRASLVVVEIAFSMVLLIGAGLMMRTFFALTHVDLGFSPRNILTLRLPLPDRAYRNKQKNRSFSQDVLQRLNALPGVVAAAETISLPPYETGGRSEVTVPGTTHSEKWESQIEFVSDGYFKTLGVPLLQGASLSAVDVDGARHVAVVNRSLAWKFFGRDNPIGRIIKFNAFNEDPDAPHDAYFVIIGVVADARNQGLQNAPAPEAFLPYTIFSLPGGTILIRTAVELTSLLPAVRRAVWAVDPNIPIAQAGSLESFLQRDVFAFPQFEFATLGSFASIGLLLVGIGVFSVMAYSVSLQKHDIGIRMAIGAQQRDILRMMLREGLRLTLSGVLIGLLASFELTRFLAHQIWGVSQADPLSFSVVAACVVAVGLAACLIPARRAANVDPMVALRYE